MEDNFIYTTSIPEHAREENVIKERGVRRGKTVKNYYLGQNYIGRRIYDRNGLLEFEISYKNKKKHGWEYHWHNGRLAWATPYYNGREHGTAFSLGSTGKLLGAYTMDHGTGLFLWWDEMEDDKPQLMVARMVSETNIADYEYWFEWGRPGILQKEYWNQNCERHGIERQWENGILKPGFPIYWIHNQEVDKQTYQVAALMDVTLMPYKFKDDGPTRVFPPEVAVHLG